jgi:hypothetical protein
MKIVVLQKKLIAAARSHPPSDRVPYAFEKRILARLHSPPAPDFWTLWGRALWRAAASCVAITLLLAAWTIFSVHGHTSSADFAQDLDHTVLAAVDDLSDSW